MSFHPSPWQVTQAMEHDRSSINEDEWISVGWMDGRMDGQMMAGWMNGWEDGWMDG